MKKQLLAVAVATTMSAVAFADISIRGDAHFEYSYKDVSDSSVFASQDGENRSRQRVRLHVTGKSGDTTIKVGLRNDGRTRVSGGANASDGARGTGSGAGNAGDSSSQLNVDYQYITTKIGALNIKAGDWWDTTGLGVARKGKADADRIEFSTKIGGWRAAVETGAESSSTVLSAKGKIGDFNVTFEHNTNVSLDGEEPTAITAEQADINDGYVGPNGLDAIHEGDYTDISIKGKIGAIGVAAEYFAGTNDTRDDAGLGDDADAALVHLWTKVGEVTWHAAWAQTDAGVAGITGSGNKFSPLGVSILATAPGGSGDVALGNFGDAEDSVWGIRADTKVAGMGLQVAVGNLEINDGSVTVDGVARDADDTFWDIIVTRPLGKGSNIRFSVGEWEDATSAGARISVKF